MEEVFGLAYNKLFINMWESFHMAVAYKMLIKARLQDFAVMNQTGFGPSA